MVIVICYSRFPNDVRIGRKSAKSYNHLEKHGYKYEIVKSNPHEITFRPAPQNSFTNGLLLDLDKLRMHLGLSLCSLLIWCFQFQSLNDDLSDHNIQKLNFNLRQLYKEKQRNSFNKKHNFLNSIYNKYPASTCPVQGNNDNQNTRSETDLLNRLEKSFQQSHNTNKGNQRKVQKT
jgi:hypothetical protein